MNQTKKTSVDSWEMRLPVNDTTESLSSPPNPFTSSLSWSNPLNTPGMPKSPKIAKPLSNIDSLSASNSNGNSPSKLQNHSAHSSCSSTDSSPQLLMNYSPKHSRKPSSLSSNRNINMKNLSLNLDDKERKKSLTLSIPVASPQSPFVATNQNQSQHQNSSHTHTVHSSSSSSSTTSKSSFDEPHPLSPKDKLPIMPSLETSKDYKFPDTQVVSEFKSLSVQSKFPEELQELNQLDAYQNGPANVLNNSIYLYSEPNIEEINNYDLVINVAKECKDLSSEFNPQNLPNKKYVYVPWNHTSSISKELTYLTEVIKQFDDSDLALNNNPKSSKNHNDSKTAVPHRKILIHCQCGVSRSACVVVAYFMTKFKINVNDAYALLKSGTNDDSLDTNKHVHDMGYDIDSCSRVCPNMSLIFELMEFYETLNTSV